MCVDPLEMPSKYVKKARGHKMSLLCNNQKLEEASRAVWGAKVHPPEQSEGNAQECAWAPHGPQQGGGEVHRGEVHRGDGPAVRPLGLPLHADGPSDVCQAVPYMDKKGYVT